MDDPAIVAALVQRDPVGLDAAYRRYADQLYAYCRSMLRDQHVAADVVQDTFIIASQRATQLREPDRLRAWLYAIARHECLRVLRTRKRSVPLEEAGDPAADGPDAATGVQRAQVRELVGAAVAGLSETDREVIELAIRHDLSPVEVGTILGLSANHAHARMSRARAQLLRSLGALLVARTGDCPALNDLLRGWDGQLTVLLRKRIARHIDDCATCSAQQDERLKPAVLLPAYAALAFAPAPQWIRSGSWPAALRRPGRWRVPAAAAAVALLVGTGIALGLSRSPSPVLPLAASPSPPATAAAPTAAVSSLVSSAADSPAAVSPGSGVDDVVPPSSSPSPGFAATQGSFVAPFTATAQVLRTCGGSSWRVRVGVSASASLASATFYWRRIAIKQKALTVTGPAVASGQVTGLLGPSITWWVVAKATDGRTFTTAQSTAANPCP